jgi:hypothetical protein
LKSYSYLRTAMVGLLIGLGAAVFDQTRVQGFHLLGSISAYYYTPAQAIFVGSLIGLAACMIALKGTTGLEDIFLNLGGMFAAVVAIVPTSRGEDYRTAIRACEHAGGALLTQKASTVDCPTVEALARATRANIENNTVTLLVVGGLGLVATLLFALRYGGPSGQRPLTTLEFWLGFAAAFVVWSGAAVALGTAENWFIERAHFIAAAGLFLSIIAVAITNAVRQDREQGRSAPALIGSPRRIGRYAWVVWLMVGSAAVFGALVRFHVVSLFWLETDVAVLFAVFWMVQTVEQLPAPRRGP